MSSKEIIFRDPEIVSRHSYQLTVSLGERRFVRVRVPCKFPRGWQRGSPEQLEASVQYVIQQSSGADPRGDATKWVLEHSSHLKNLIKKRKR